MKTQLILLLLFAPLICFAQKVGVSATEFNRSFYKGIKYTISIYVENTPPEQITAKVSSGYIKKLDGYEFEINTYAKDKVSISVYAEDVLIGKQDYKTIDLPSPRVGFCSHCCGGGAHNFSETLKAKFELQFRDPEIGVGVPYEILGFEIELSDESGFIETLASEGKFFSDAQKKAVGKLRFGQRMVVQNIKMRFPDGSVQTIGTFHFKHANGLNSGGCNEKIKRSPRTSTSNTFIINKPPELASVLGISSKNGKPVELSLTDFLGAEKIDLTGKSYGLYNAKRILSFDLTVSKEKEMAITESSDSEFLNSKQKNLIASCKPYDLILFENIKAVSAEGKIINLNSISFSVK